MDDFLKYGDAFFNKYMLTLNPIYLEESRDYYEKALPHPTAKLRLYIIYRLLGEDSKAQALYDELSRPQQKYVDAWFIYPENPIRALSILEGDADFFEYYLLKITILMMLERYKDTVELLRRLEGRFPDEYVKPLLNTLEKFFKAKDTTMQEIVIDKKGNIVRTREYEVAGGEQMLKEINAEEGPDGYIIRLPKDPELKDLGVYFLTHSHTSVPAELIRRLKWSG